MTILRSVLTTALCITLVSTAHASSNHCGDEGVWIEILGAGSGELNDGQASPSYLIWHDNIARVLVDAGSGSQIGFEKSGARFESIEAIEVEDTTASGRLASLRDEIGEGDAPAKEGAIEDRMKKFFGDGS